MPARPRRKTARRRPLVEWSHYAGDRASTKYSPAAQIDAGNVAKLEIAWRWTTPDRGIDTKAPFGNLKGTPLMVGGVVYAVSSLNLVSALDARTGKELWTYDPKAYLLHKPTHGGFTQRGLEHWSDGTTSRILLVTSTHQLVSLDPATGKPDPAFGEDGTVDMRPDVAEPKQLELTGMNSPPIVCADTVMMGNTGYDFPLSKAEPPGHIRGYDVRTGKKKWVFHTVPQAGEPGNETWLEDSWRYTGNTNVWSWMSCDEELGLVFLPLATPSSDYYGGHRPGDNLYAESLVALDARTGERKWHFQAVHHGLWDYDFPCAPNLVDITVDGRPVKAVAQVSKQGFTYVFERATGKPLWPIEERPVAASTVPGEWTAPTQPFPTKPPAFDRQGLVESDLPRPHAGAEERSAGHVLPSRGRTALHAADRGRCRTASGRWCSSPAKPAAPTGAARRSIPRAASCSCPRRRDSAPWGSRHRPSVRSPICATCRSSSRCWVLRACR